MIEEASSKYLCAVLSPIFKDIRKNITFVFTLKESSFTKIIIYPHTDIPPHSSVGH